LFGGFAAICVAAKDRMRTNAPSDLDCFEEAGKEGKAMLRTILLGMALIVMLWLPSAAVAQNDAIFQLHYDGRIYRFTGALCSNSNGCPGWQMLDTNPASGTLAAGGAGASLQLYQLHRNGSIWRFKGAPCTAAAACSGWQAIGFDRGTRAIIATSGALYQLRGNGTVWRYTGTPCAGLSNCPGWEQLDNERGTIALAADGNRLYQLRGNGEIWGYTGMACTDPDTCTGWQRLGNNRPPR
jgi:hypothetical protein